MPEPFTQPEQAVTFIRAGNARLTVRSCKTGTRYTYRVRAASSPANDHRRRFFVELLKGPDNNADYTYLGMVCENEFFTTKATKHLAESAYVKAFKYVYTHLTRGHMPPHAELWHESRCGRCGRALTVPASIQSGLGPECAGRVGE